MAFRPAVQVSTFLAPCAQGKLDFSLILYEMLISGILLSGCRYIHRAVMAHLKSWENQFVDMKKSPGYCEYEI